MQSSFVFFVVLLTIGLVHSARPNDEIKLTAFNESYFIANETYTFKLVPLYQIPLQLYRHVIYTATTEVVQGKTKRALVQNKDSLYDLAQEDYDLLSSFVQEELPYVRVDTKKRAFAANSEGVRAIPLAAKATLFVRSDSESMKRAVPLGTGVCLHIPFFTTCDNKQDLTDVKNALSTATQAFRTEIDSYKETNNQRANEMAATLDRQRNMLIGLAAETSATLGFISTLASTTSINAAQIAHGDYIVHAQIDYLKRITNSLLRFTNALSSTDPRALVAQPSLTKLFEGYKYTLDYLTNQADPAMIPITDSRTFTWTEVPLPTSSVRSVDVSFSAVPFVSTAVQINVSRGFLAVTTMSCNGVATSVGRCANPVPGNSNMRANNVNGGDNWVFGPFHQNHVGIYPVFGNNVNSSSFTNVINTGVPKPFITNPRTGGPNGAVATSLYCVDFLGYKMLATMAFTPNMLNGINSNSANPPYSNCNNYRFRDTQLTAGNRHYFLFALIEGIVVPFYSNCDPQTFVTATNATVPVNYLIHYPSTNMSLDTSAIPTNDLFTTYEINARHAVSPTCYMNLEPEWIGLSYYIPPTNVKSIPDIPRGYKLNQFTINPAGELASSLEFVYTQKWAWAYKIIRISPNRVVVDEANQLDESVVLFNLDGNTVVDESDSFYGEGNNGRDCVRYSATYDYDLLSCFFQNDQAGYSADEFLAGSVQTTGIARFVNKFQFSLDTTVTTTVLNGTSAPSYKFSLKPKNDADFSFFVESDGSVCPKLISANSTVSGCTYQLAYTGQQIITFTGLTGRVSFFADNTSQILSVPFSDPSALVRSVYAGGKECILLRCVYGGNAATSSVRVEKPNVQIVSADDKALLGKVSLLVDKTLNDTLNSMQTVQDKVAISQQNIKKISDALSTLDFNMTKLVPYEDFTQLRKQVDRMIGSLNSGGANECASGVFGSAGCFGRDLINTVVTVAIIVVILLAGYIVCFKFGVAEKLGICKKSDEGF